MNKYFKILIIVTIGIPFIGILMYQISLWNQNQILDKYSYEFNSKRTDIGLKEIPK